MHARGRDGAGGFARSARSARPARPAPPVATESAETLLTLIRSHGYRASTHRLLGAVEMRATKLADRANAITARVDATGRATDDNLRCARALAGKLGVR